jgi:CubicO group peptidase (beta-lactamase class C family)
LLSLLFVTNSVAGLAQPSTMNTETSTLEKTFVESVARNERVKGTGIAVTVLKDRKPFYTGALGLRDRAARTPVTVDTVFSIGSSTKPFTSMALAMLSDSKRVRLDVPVRQYLSDFFLRDPGAERNITLEDILSHRTGVPRHDALWYLGPFNRVELVHRLRYLDPNSMTGHGFRKSFEYNNIMYSAAAYVLETVTGERWDDFVQTNILNRLEMQKTSLTLAQFMREQNRAKGYLGELELSPFDLDNIGPAGAINANVRDLTNWVFLHLNRGITPSGTKLVEPTSLEQMYEPYVVSNPGHGETYGLGWFVLRNQGKRFIHHGGNALGYTAFVSLMPDDGVGMAVLTNQHNSDLARGVACDLYLHLLPETASAFCLTDRLARYDTIDVRPASYKEPEAGPQFGVSASPIPPISDYAGMYSNQGYGDISVSVRGIRLYMSYYQHSWPLTLANRDVFVFPLEAFGASYPRVPVMFSRTSSGQVDKLAIPLEPAVGLIPFMKR